MSTELHRNAHATLCTSIHIIRNSGYAHAHKHPNGHDTTLNPQKRTREAPCCIEVHLHTSIVRIVRIVPWCISTTLIVKYPQNPPSLIDDQVTTSTLLQWLQTAKRTFSSILKPTTSGHPESWWLRITESRVHAKSCTVNPSAATARRRTGQWSQARMPDIGMTIHPAKHRGHRTQSGCEISSISISSSSGVGGDSRANSCKNSSTSLSMSTCSRSVSMDFISFRITPSKAPSRLARSRSRSASRSEANRSEHSSRRRWREDSRSDLLRALMGMRRRLLVMG